MKTRKYVIIMMMLILTAIILPGCKDDNAGDSNSTQAATQPAQPQPPAEPVTDNPPEAAQDYAPELLVEPSMPAVYGANDWETREQVLNENQVDVEFVTALNDFAYKTSGAVLPQASNNRNFSPLSLYYALAITATGANGNTFDELAALLLLGANDKEVLSAQSGNLFRVLYTQNDITKLKLANSLWLREGFKVNDDFVKNAVSQFYAWVYTADFANAGASKAVSKWIAANTEGTIEPEISLEKDTMMLIINTIYFYDEWQEAFAKEETAKDKFFVVGGNEVEADFMHKTFGNKAYFKGNDFTRIDLGLKGRNTMTFVLPDEGVDINDILADADKLQAVFENGERDDAKVLLYLPKFKYGSEFKLVEALKALGVNDAFDDKADFSALSPEDGLYISDIIQQSHIGLDENGVEAAAYTMVMISKMSMPIELEKTVELKFNRPFLFSIKAENGAILFIGVCDNPAQ